MRRVEVKIDDKNPDALHRTGRRISVYLSRDVATKLYAEKGKTGVEMSAIIERALLAYFGGE